MKVDYQLEPTDFTAIARERRRFMPHSWLRIYYFAVLPVLCVALAVASRSVVLAAVFTTLFIGSAWLTQAGVQRGYRRTVYSNENLAFSARRWSASLTDEGIRIISEAAEVLYRWPSIRQVVRDSRFVRFDLTPLQRVHIPIRAFRDEAHIQEFLRTAQSYVKGPAA